MRPIALLLLIVWLVTACAPAAAPTAVSTNAPTEEITPEATVEATVEVTEAVVLTCEQVLDQALAQIAGTCGELGRNEVCYGNDLVEASFRDGAETASTTFAQVGDTVDLASLQSIRTARLDADARQWGIAVVKAQVTLPDTLPGQNVTFLLFGDATMDNPTPDMRAVTIRTGLGETGCEAAPSAVVVQAPEGERVEMTINGAGLSLGSTVIITAEPGGEMVVATLEGIAEITAFDKTEAIVPGTQVRLPLSADRDAPMVSGPPSKPEAYDTAMVRRVPVQLLDRPVEFPDPVTPRLTATPTDEPTHPPTVEPTTAPTVEPTVEPTIEPTDAPTLTPTATKEPTDPQLRSDRDTIARGECTTIRWEIPPESNVFFEGQPTRTTSREVCPTAPRTYTLLVQDQSGAQTPYIISIRVE